jgi:WD40 repeat protein
MRYQVTGVQRGGKIAADSENSGHVRLRDVATHRLTGSYTADSCQYSPVALSPDGTTIAAVDGNNTAELWGVATHKQISALSQHGPQRRRRAEPTFSPDSKTLTVLADNSTVPLWDVATRTGMHNSRICPPPRGEHQASKRVWGSRTRPRALIWSFTRLARIR